MTLQASRRKTGMGWKSTSPKDECIEEAMTDESQENRRPRVLLGISGSVAAVKGPEIAVRLAREVKVDVCVLLTAGGVNFWNKAQAYDPAYWDELQKYVVDNGETREEVGRIHIHSE